MNNMAVVDNSSSKNIIDREKSIPITGTLTRLVDRFEASNPINQDCTGVIKNYIYIHQKRIIA